VRGFRAALLLLRKDVLLLWRAPAFAAVLVGYPVLVAILVAVALQSGDRRPAVAFVNEDVSGRTVQVARERLSVDDYVRRIEDDVDLKRLSAEEARQALDAGRVSAVLTIPENFIADLQSGVRPPVIDLATSRRSPLEADQITRRLEAAVFRLNLGLSQTYVDQVLRLVQIIRDGGDAVIFGRTDALLGLRRSGALITEIDAALRRLGEDGLAARLQPLREFIGSTGENLDLAEPSARAIRSPVQLRVTQGEEDREPLSAFGFAGALLVSVGLVGVLLAAAVLSSEREDNTLARLGRGLVSPGALVAEKVVFAALACLVVGLVLLVVVGLFTPVTVGRWGLWVLALLAGGCAFGAFGVLVGALARETRTALLAGLMIALPLLFLGLVPGNETASVVAALSPFGPAFELFQGLLVDPSVGGDLGVSFGHLALVAVVYAAAAALGLARRARV
jgi:ABC-type multidrug transport system permease subunit